MKTKVGKMAEEAAYLVKIKTLEATDKVKEFAEANPELAGALAFAAGMTALDCIKFAVKAHTAKKEVRRRMAQESFYDFRNHCWYALRRPMSNNEKYVLNRRVHNGFDAYTELKRMGLV